MAIKNMFDDAKALKTRDSELIASWEDNGVRYDVVRHANSEGDRMSREHRNRLATMIRFSRECGYVTFPERPIVTPGYSGLMNLVSVHGGVTFAEPVDAKHPELAYTYGFDTAHAGDVGRAFTVDFMRRQLEDLAEQIKVIAPFSREYDDRLKQLEEDSDKYNDKVLNKIASKAEKVLEHWQRGKKGSRSLGYKN